MYGFQKIKLSFLFLLAIMASGLFVVHTAKAAEYDIGVSRQYYDEASDTIVGVGGHSYTQEYFTGLGFCTGYYYLNHKVDSDGNQIAQVEQVLWYNSGDLSIKDEYMNYGIIGSADWETQGLLGYDIENGNDIYKFNIQKKASSNVFIPNVYTIGRISIINNINTNSVYTVSGYYDMTDPTDGYSTFVNHTASEFVTKADADYSFDIKYYAQPCVPDMPITAGDRLPINGANGNESATRLATVPAFDDVSAARPLAGSPITTSEDDVTKVAYFTPASINLGSTFDKDITFDDGIYIDGIKEPEINSSADAAAVQYYGYDNGVAKLSVFDPLDSNFVAMTTTNQWGINPDTVKVTVEFIGVDKTNFAAAGTSCTIIITGTSNLGLVGLGHSWNRNQLGYEVHITSGTIRTLAHSVCPGIATLAANIDLKRETVANISWDAYDYANSMIISQDNNTVSYRGANQITGVTNYDFNSYSADPILSMSTDSTALSHGIYVYNIPVNNSQLLFTGTDVYAGVDSGTFLIIVTGYNSNIDKSDSRDTSVSPDYTYTFSGTDITKFGYGETYDRFDYTGFVNFASKGAVTTGMHFDIYFEVDDFVLNKETQNYTFRTPTYPNAPKSAGNLTPTAQTNQEIDTINIINNVLDSDTVDGGGAHYNYSFYYPSHQDLITDFEYISGSNYVNSTTDLVLTAENGNNGGATMVTMTGLIFNYDGSGSYVSGTPHVSSGGEIMTDYLDTMFTFEILATNIYGITGIITYNITVAPSCMESPGCTDPVYVYWGLDLASAQAQKDAAVLSGTDYMKNNHWYPHRFAEIKQTGPNFYFTGVNGEADAKVLYCASENNELLISHSDYAGPRMDVTNLNASSSESYTSSNALSVTGSDVLLFDVFTGRVTANYDTVEANGTQRMTIYVNRPLTGRVFYSVCELTGFALGDFDCPESSSHNRTGDVNWTQLTNADTFTMTGWTEGGWLTGDNANDWGTGFVSNGGGTRKYVQNITGDLEDDINTNGSVSIDLLSRNGRTGTVNHEVYWIDNTEVSMTGDVAVVENQSAVVTLSGYNTGVLAASGELNLIGDDEYIVTKFSGAVEAKIFETVFGSTIHTGQFYIAGEGSSYKMIHEITFAEDRVGEICVEDRAGNESCMDLEVTGIGTMEELVITVRPAFRPDPATNDTGYSIVGADFWFWIMSGDVWTQNYNSAKGDAKIDTNKNGTGLVYIMTPASGAQYLVVFKGSGTLSAGFTGIWSDTITDMNFFSGTYADNLSSEYVYKFNNAGTLEHYLKLGDIVANGTGSYDYIADADFALMNTHLTVGSTVTHEYWYDFDINGVISSMEQSMILQAWGKHGFIGHIDPTIPMTGFVNL